MAKRGKKYRAALSKVDRDKNYDLLEACKLVKETSFSKMDASVDLAVNLGVDPRHADQNLRGAILLPHGLGKKVRIVVFARGEKANEATNLGADAVGGDDLAKRISEGWLDFDQVIATPDMMGVVGKLGKVLGPRGLMPNPKLGTVTFEVEKAINELRSGRAEYRVDKAGIVHLSIGRTNFTPENLADNAKTIIDTLLRVKPSTAKGTYLKKMALSATMGPGVRVDSTPFKI
ncbi:MAG: 50S ribosomal protein L1 [Proteobacteria bacterium]|nr:MAG: 50S ribosomal protein L1 [Pseudomonadota bacterium]